VELSQIKY
jgi:hypothetical protein